MWLLSRDSANLGSPNVSGIRKYPLKSGSKTKQGNLIAFAARSAVLVNIILGLTLLSLSSLVFGAGATPVSLFRTYSGNIDYVATGRSFRDEPNTVDSCSFVSPMSSSVVLNIPATASIVEAFLYFAGSGSDTAPIHNVSTQSGLLLNGSPISTIPGLDEENYEVTDLAGTTIDFYGARRDVTSIVTGPGVYTFSGLDVHTTAEGRPNNQTCLGAFGLVVIYEDPGITDIKVLNLFDGFEDFQNRDFDLEPRNFVLNASAGGKATHITYEGDETLGAGTGGCPTCEEKFKVGIPDGSSFDDLINPINPTDNQFNSTVSGPDVFDTSTTYGLDIDTYDLAPYLVGNQDEFTATTNYSAAQDLVILQSEIIIVDNKDLADIEVTLNDVGTFTSNTTNSAQYLISVENNGDGTTILTSGFATGFIHLYDDLPAGISIDNISDITAPGWDCSATVLASNQIRCSYDLSTLPGGQLDRNDALPDVLVTVDIATPTSPVTNIARITLCDNDPDTCTTFDNKHTDASQFDPINFFEDGLTIFTINAKNGTNNNVDNEISVVVTGSPSDLSTSTKSVNDINGAPLAPGDTLEYTISLNETGGVAATGVSITDTIDSDTESFSYQSTSCGGSPTPSFSLGTFTITDITVPANSTCSVIYEVTVKALATAGSMIDNTATITSDNGSGASPGSPTLLVAGIATGSKVLYLDSLAANPRVLSRSAPVTDSTTTINDSPGSRTMLLSPTLADDLDINSGIIPVSVWIEATTDGIYDIEARLRYDSTGAATVIGTDTITNVMMLAGTANAQLFPFQIVLGSDITDLDTGENLELRIQNLAASDDDIILHSKLNSVESSVIVDAANVINVETITFYSDAARTAAITTIETGMDIYIEGVVSDPFGAFDITDAKLTLIDPNVANQLTAVSMTEDVGELTAGTKTFFYAYTVPPADSIDPGTWIAQITAEEGYEGTITHTEVNTFDTTAPTIEVMYEVTPLTASPGDTLTYSVTITNAGSSTSLDISQAIPIGTENLQNITISSSGNSSASTSTLLDIQNVTAATGVTTITFTVDVLPGAQSGDLIDHTIIIDNMGTSVEAIAPSVLILPFIAPPGNKLLYADNLGGAPILDRTPPLSDTTRTINSQGASSTLVLSPVLQSDLTLNAGDIKGAVWVTRGASFEGERTIQATLAYTGASTGTLGTDTVTITLMEGAAGAQYVPFTINLGSPLTLLANTSITLTITNNTSVFGESITIHSFEDLIHPTQFALNASAPLNVTAIEFFNNDIDAGGTQITSAAPGSTVWVRATIEDPFGSADITSANLTITDPLSVVTLMNAPMSIPTTQPVSGAQRYFQSSHTLSAELGDWNVAVVAAEGTEGTVTASDNVLFNVNNNTPSLVDSYKTVQNTTTGDNSNTNENDTLHYSIELVESMGGDATSVSVTDVIPVNTTFVSGSLEVGGVVQADPAGNINLTGLTVLASSTLTIEFDVTVNPATSVGTIISNTADVVNPTGAVTDLTLDAEDIVIGGVPAAGTKFLYLDDLNGAGILTRSEPTTAGTTDSVVLAQTGGSIDMDLTLAGAITLDPADGNVFVRFRVARVGAGFGFRQVQGTLSYHNGGAATPLGTVTQNIFPAATPGTQLLSIPLSAITTIPAGYQLRLTLTNTSPAFGGTPLNIQVYSYDGGGGALRSRVELVPDPVINVDSITFWSDTMGAGTQVTNPDPDATDVDIYAKIVISDPFGDYDIQAPDALVNPTTVLVTDPDAAATLDASVACTAPCYAYDGEDVVNDPPGDSTRTFYYIVRINSDPPSTRGTWTVQVTANEGLETGVISHVAADAFTTLTKPNLSTSTKNWTHAGDVDPGETLVYTITLINTSAQDADNAVFSDTLATTPVSLTFVSAATTCTDETFTALPNPTHAAGVVSLSNISVPAISSCTITVNATVGAGNPGDLIDNTAQIINPGGPGATPVAPTVILSQSMIAAVGSKQLYLDNLAATPILTRTPPTSAGELDTAASTTSIINYPTVTAKEMTLETGTVVANLWMRKTGGGFAANVSVELFIDANDGSGFVSIDSVTANLFLNTTAQLVTLSLTNAAPITMNAGSQIRLTISNNGTGYTVHTSQVTSAPVSEILLPVSNSIEVIDMKFFDLSGDDMPGCTPTCGTEITPGAVSPGGTIWTRVVISDAFGSNDVNTGCDGVTSTNCPTIEITDPTSGDQTPVSPADELTFLTEPDSASRTYEFEITPAGFGLEGTWQIEVIGAEGTEASIFDSGVETFELFGNPVLTIVKTVSGTTSPGQVVIYNNDVNNTGTGPALVVTLTNLMGDFIGIELTEASGNWTSVFSLSAPYTVNVETWDSGDNSFTYDPTLVCGAAIPSNSPCYDNNILRWRIELNESMPVSGNLVQEYKAIIE